MKIKSTLNGVGGDLKSFGDVIALLQLSFPKLDSAISGVKIAVGEATGGFGKLKAAGTSAFTGIKSLISAHPFIAVITALTAIYTIAKKVDEHFGISVKEAKNKLDEVKSECSELESELSSLNNELETTKDIIETLEAKDTLVFLGGLGISYNH